MEFTTYTNRICLISLFALVFLSCRAQVRCQNDINQFIMGRWKCIESDYSGYQKFTLEQANQIRNSILTVSSKGFSYEGVDFIEPCKFTKWKIARYDTSEYLGISIEFKYPKSELAKILTLMPVNENGKFDCYNECAIFFLKQDTLINICGGYTFYLIKSYSGKREDFSGTGSNAKEFELTGSEISLKLSYNFYKKRDQLIIKDKHGNILFKTEMTGTEGEQKKEIDLLNMDNIDKLIFKINSETPSSKWKISVELNL